jgi:SAM-dependent methyltransferase
MNATSTERCRPYWEANIQNWGEFYANTSHFNEEIQAPWWVRPFYIRLIVPVERKLMQKRYQLTMDFINNHVGPGMTALDVGCGTGIFTVAMLRRGARVVAVDYAEKALQLTREHVRQQIPERIRDLDCLQLDVTTTPLPPSDAALAMGVTPYMHDITSFYENVLSSTKTFYCLLLNPRHWANRVRRWISWLNVRQVNCFDPARVDALLRKHNFHLNSRVPFATGYLDLAARGPDR